MKKAIVFAGGGSKGAYQIGAWKALNELGETFDIAAGTSIGSINAAFYVQHDFDAAYELWQQLRAGDIMANGINLDKSFEMIFSQRDQLIPFVKNYINSKGADVAPFHEMLKKSYDPERFFASDVDYALMTVKFPSMEPVCVRKNDITDRENGWKWIAASAACFPVFPVMEIDGESYIDGGYYDNIPVASAFSLGADRVTVIDLKPENNHEGYIRHPWVTYIKPARDLGTFLNFDREVLDRSIKLGYDDTMKAYGKYLGRLFTFLPAEEKEKYSSLSQLFLGVLTEMEAAFDFSGTVRFQRINKQPGCTSILSAKCADGKADEVGMFIAALETYLTLLGYDDLKEYTLDDLLYELKTDVDGLYPMLEFDARDAFNKMKEYIEKKTSEKNPELKKIDDDRQRLIITAFARTLQKMTLF